MAFIEEIIKKWPYGIYIGALVVIVWKCAKIFHEFRDMKKKTENLQITANNNENMLRELQSKTDVVRSIGKKIDDRIEPTLIKINSTLDKLTMYIITQNSLEAGYFTSHSPIELNEAAKKILKRSGAKTLIDNNIEFLISRIEDKNPKSMLDIQESAISIIFDLADTEIFSNLKDFLYQNPKFEDKAIDMPIIINIMAIYLRDEFFKKHPELLKIS